MAATKNPQRNWNVWVQEKGGQPHLEVLAGHSNLTLAEADWLYAEYKAGRFVGYRKRQLNESTTHPALALVKPKPKPNAKPKPVKVKPLTMQERAWREAQRLIGVMEAAGHNNTGTTGPVSVNEIIRENGGMLGEPWCGDFVAHCYRTAGSKAVQRAWAAANSLGVIGGMTPRNVRKLVMGDIVVFQFGPGEYHTGLFGYYCDAEGRPVNASSAQYICTIEGNTGTVGAVSDSKTGGDGVYKKVRAISLVHRGVRVLR